MVESSSTSGNVDKSDKLFASVSDLAQKFALGFTNVSPLGNSRRGKKLKELPKRSLLLLMVRIWVLLLLHLRSLSLPGIIPTVDKMLIQGPTTDMGMKFHNRDSISLIW